MEILIEKPTEQIMEVIENKAEETKAVEVQAEVAEQLKPKVKDWLEQMTEGIARAEKLATTIREKVLLPQFTLAQMARLMRIGYEEAQQRLNFIRQFGYIDDERRNGIPHFKIVSDPKDRLKQIDETALAVKARYDREVNGLKAMREITSSYIKEDNSETKLREYADQQANPTPAKIGEE